jgi:hypothetical protein
MIAPSFPSERKAGEKREDRSPDLRLLQPPSQKRVQGLVSSGFPDPPALVERPWLKFCLHPAAQYDGPGGRGAHSCGAVAEFHRLPEHPGDCRGELRCPLKEQPNAMERFP